METVKVIDDILRFEEVDVSPIFVGIGINYNTNFTQVNY